MAQRLLLVCALCSLVLACTVQPPEGRLPCVAASDCPDDWVCGVGRGRSTPACYRSTPAFDAGDVDASQVMAQLDAAEPEATPSDAALDAAYTALDAEPDATSSPPSDAALEQDAAAPPDAEPAPSDSEVIEPMNPDAGAPADCERVAPERDRGIFVSLVQSSMLDNCGSIEQPCGTIAKGLAQAQRFARPNVYVDSGMYAEAKLSLPAGVSLIGGWDNLGGTWTRRCPVAGREHNVTVLSTDLVALEAEYAGESTIDSLTLRARNTDIPPGESSLGVMARGAETRLRLVTV
ncbi:MAG: hypothetical protein ABW321_05200, partial [Polyangiales bacterium]